MLHARWLAAAVFAVFSPLALAETAGDNLDRLPEQVRATRAAMLAAAKAGDLDGLQAIIDESGKPTHLGFGGAKTAAEFAISNSGTGDGLDTLAELVDILETPYEAVDDGEGGKFYIWPYLAGADLANLSDADKVVAYQLIDPASLPDFIDYGGWLAMRTIIDEDGSWQAWVLGD